MRLGAIIGPVPPAQHFATLLQNSEHEVVYVGPAEAEAWLREIAPNATFMAGDGLAACARFMADQKIEAAVVVGPFHLRPDRPVLPRLVKAMDLYEPMATLRTLAETLGKVELINILKVLPQLAVSPGSSSGSITLEEAQITLEACVEAVTSSTRQVAAQAFIVDQGKIIQVGQPHHTNKMIRSFGTSAKRKAAVRPLLCKIANPAFFGVYPPIVGQTTADLCEEHGLAGIVVEASATVVLQQEKLLGRVAGGQLASSALAGGGGVIEDRIVGGRAFCGVNKVSNDR